MLLILRMGLYEIRDEGTLRDHAQAVFHGVVQGRFGERGANAASIQGCRNFGVGECDDVRLKKVIQKCSLCADLGFETMLEPVLSNRKLHMFCTI